ncbi:MAG TPA: phosphoribosylformylglycinamidine synthase subunit PurQ [Actinomycetota bacterium]|nr:phosphoribosylformylglycinamidine synthase subunit PurQ [Actinomycetota bacterium]
MSARVSIVVFPGSNCELDVQTAFRGLGADAQLVWHAEDKFSDTDIVVLPGGFAHGDYLRTGAIARFSPVMDAVREHADGGGLVIGICNGFQILCEAGLLPGAMRKNAGLKFRCMWTDLRVETSESPFTSATSVGHTLRIPINHFEGNWYCESRELERLQGNGQIVFRYVDNPNGSLDDVAGIVNADRNVLGMMPHPERACEALLGSADGAFIFSSMLHHIRERDAVSV